MTRPHPRPSQGTSTRLFALALAVLAVASSPSASAAKPKEDQRPPHIVYILADDLGWADVGYHGSDIQTPTIDALAAGGTSLDQFYVQPMCTQTRAALMTGRYPFRYGLQTAVIPSASVYGLDTDEWLLPQALKKAGYTTAIAGKWHLGHGDRKYWPKQRGFDHQYGALLGEIDYFTHAAHGTVDWFRDNVRVDEKGYVTELLGRDAVDVIEKHDTSKPLFLYLAFTAPHAPYQAPQEYLDRYARIEDPSRRAYAAMTTAMDDQIAKVLAALDAKGMRKDTLVIFHSDNGGPLSSEVTGEVDTSGGKIPCNNLPYRDGKGTLYEGGTRVPSIVNWPGRIEAGAKRDGMIHVVDMFPTLAGLAGVKKHEGRPLDGMDVWSTILDGSPSPRHEMVYNIDPFLAAVRQDDFKLVWKVPLPSKVELFDMAGDPYETTNLASKHPDKVTALQRRAQQLAAEGQRPLVIRDVGGAARTVLFGSVAIPDDAPKKAAH